MLNLLLAREDQEDDSGDDEKRRNYSHITPMSELLVAAKQPIKGINRSLPPNGSSDDSEELEDSDDNRTLSTKIKKISERSSSPVYHNDNAFVACSVEPSTIMSNINKKPRSESYQKNNLAMKQIRTSSSRDHHIVDSSSRDHDHEDIDSSRSYLRVDDQYNTNSSDHSAPLLVEDTSTKKKQRLVKKNSSKK